MKNLTYRELTYILRKLGCYELERKGGGSHRKWYNPNTGRSTVIPDWGKRPLKKGTVNAIIKQLLIDKDQFLSLLED